MIDRNNIESSKDNSSENEHSEISLKTRKRRLRKSKKVIKTSRKSLEKSAKALRKSFSVVQRLLAQEKVQN